MQHTQLHEFSNCTSALDRYTWRHNFVLTTILHFHSSIQSNYVKLFADLSGNNPVHRFYSTHKYRQGPDIVIQDDRKYTLIELTVLYQIIFLIKVT